MSLLSDSSRLARFTASPMAVYSSLCLSEPMFPTTASPVLMPMPMRRSAGPPGRGPARVQPLQLGHHRQRAVGGAAGVVGRGERRAPERHHRVADELVERAAVVEDDLRHRAQVLVQHGHHLLGGELLRERGEAADVAEEDGERHALPAQHQVVVLVGQAPHDLGVHVAAHQPAHAALRAPLGHVVGRLRPRVRQHPGQRRRRHVEPHPRGEGRQRRGGRQQHAPAAPPPSPRRRDHQRGRAGGGQRRRRHRRRVGPPRRAPQEVAAQQVVERGGVDDHPGLRPERRAAQVVVPPRRGVGDQHHLPAERSPARWPAGGRGRRPRSSAPPRVRVDRVGLPAPLESGPRQRSSICPVVQRDRGRPRPQRAGAAVTGPP